ncbi:MAG TPA: DUF4157 domain-containing protein [Leptolyngbyaceae cyanobacterium]
MRERIHQGKKTTSSVSIPSLKQPTRGFGLDSLNASPPAVTQVQPMNKPPSHDISRIALHRPQAKLTISQPGDFYEQQADSVAQQVIQRIAQSGNRQSIQRQQAPEEEEQLQMKPLDISTLQRQQAPQEEELQMKPLDISTLQRQQAPEEEELQTKPLDISTLQRQQAPEEEELQMKPLDISTLQRQQAPEEEELQMKPIAKRQGGGGMAATSDLETSINQARGGGQPLADDIREPMEQAFGADFSGVKVHTDTQSDQLNRSIQARAFTTGQDVFFRQGEYNPGSRGGQELLAHELTHVVQQNGGAVMRSLLLSSAKTTKGQTTGNNQALSAKTRLSDRTITVQPKTTKRTEKEILNEIPHSGLTGEHSQKLIEKMGKDQSFSKSRKIAAEVEAESENLVKGLPHDQKELVRQAINNYVSSSTAIQVSARGDQNALSQSVLQLDAALQAIRQQININNQTNARIVYRSISYESAADIPYGQRAGGQQVNVGDYVGDLGFLSTSEHRQFVLGKEQVQQAAGLLKIAIYGKSGVPIALHIPPTSYTNQNLQTLYDLEQAKKNKLTQAWNAVFGSGARAGQAEILFPRNSVFEVKKIERNANTVSVVLEEFIGSRPGTVKNMKDGTPL